MPKPKKATGKEVSRWQKMKDRDIEPTFPEIEYHENLIGYLAEFGPASSGGMGLSPVSFTEIKAWSDLMGIRLTAWEVQALRTLSIEYVAQHGQSESPQSPCPYKPDSASKIDVTSVMGRTRQAVNQQLEEKNGRR